MTDTRRRPPGPVLIELEAAAPRPSPAEAAPPPDARPGPDLPEGRAMQIAARLAARRPSRLTRFFWQTALAALGFFVTLGAWNALTALIAANPLLGWLGTALLAAFALAALLVVARELAGWSRLARLDRVQREVTEAARGTDMKHARRVLRDLSGLYAGRAEMADARKRLRKRTEEVLDPDTALMLAERELMAPLDAAARLEIEAAARLVATTTALVPLALADVLTALVANLRMIRRLAELYGGRAGALGSIRLARTVLTHLVATGAVAVGDDLLGSVAGGGIVSKLSRRFGEGVVNGALTARVGVAAMEVCRPMPFVALDRPRVSNIVSRALTGLFGKEREEG
ncbi:YcjF family protein [Phaeovulum vinaykumarii]|uniref:Putative membrane protein n=1 Tax=Phaeovulum vinaykumarii TaxID=407234 RepID=A0A1N7L0Q3_9RHOB|nr:TIGR01620 family protein [Phaeovulum vinaykumarii]SIS67428.1 putative membrane protein [Phaeovulum vinaykumarii]SOC00718.1 putative membrane protein [Phaeovulum vinaykumarii]